MGWTPSVVMSNPLIERTQKKTLSESLHRKLYSCSNLGVPLKYFEKLGTKSVVCFVVFLLCTLSFPFPPTVSVCCVCVFYGHHSVYNAQNMRWFGSKLRKMLTLSYALQTHPVPFSNPPMPKCACQRQMIEGQTMGTVFSHLSILLSSTRYDKNDTRQMIQIKYRFKWGGWGYFVCYNKDFIASMARTRDKFSNERIP